MTCNLDYQSEPHVIESPTYEIPIRITRRKRRPYQNLGRTVNHHVLKNLKKMKAPKRYDIPTILSANVRSLPKKVDEIEQIALLNSAGVICITESWLSPDIPDSSISIPGYNLFRKDRIGTSGCDVRRPKYTMQNCWNFVIKHSSNQPGFQ